MVRIVILGLGARSTLFYQEKLHQLYFQLKGNYGTFPFILNQLDFNLVNPFLPENIAIISPILQYELKKYDVTDVYLLVPNITIHQILDRMNFRLNIIHPFKLLIKELANRKERKIVLFGTKFTNNNNYLTYFIDEKLIENLITAEMLFLDELRKKVYAYLETEQDLMIFNTLISKYSKNYIVIIACTELSIINRNKSTNVIDLSWLQCVESLQLITI
ncbi:aspartate racemase [Flavobacterium sp. PL11]|uniref:hypothetical protein n=1 Tax=Flavobacterium sp. PL11 TaxID=3071717 RepID=UPI002E02B8A8|nr:aspartate racemase [Flavobacterium sp. PL11]